MSETKGPFPVLLFLTKLGKIYSVRVNSLPTNSNARIGRQYAQGGETDLIISVLIGTLLFCEVNSYLFFCLKMGELQ